MRPLTVLLTIALAFNAAVRTYAQVSALCAGAQVRHAALVPNLPGASVLARRSHAQRPSVAKLQFASSISARPLKSSLLLAIQVSETQPLPSGCVAPPDHPPA
jgi:hypothetical protein